MDSVTLTLGTRWRRIVRFTPRPPLPSWKETADAHRLCGSQGRTNIFENRQIFALPFDSNISVTDGSQIYIVRSSGSWPGHCTD
jgi:hypothetical protein